MRLNMITVDRSPNPNYIGQTLESLRASDWSPVDIPLTLCVGNEKEEYTDGLGCEVLRWSGPPFETVHISFVDNYVRALRHGEGDVIVCEDDIRFMPHWVERMREGIQEIERQFSRYVLALYAARKPSHVWFRRTRHYRGYRTSRFFGTQAMYYPAAVREELADFMELNRRRRPGDLLIGEWCGQKQNRNLYALQGSIVEHVGSKSTGLGSGRHRAWRLLH